MRNTVMMTLPAEIDLTAGFDYHQLPRRGQGRRPTCSVFTMAHALEYALSVATGRGLPVSVEYLNWATGQAADRTGDGGFFSEIWAGYQAFGSCSEGMLPYREVYDPLFQPGADLQEGARASYFPLRLEWIKEWDPETGVTPEQLERIRAVLASGSPVCGGLRWPRSPVWTADVLQFCPPEAVFDGHSALLIGYRDDASLPGGGAFRIRNSNQPASGFLSYAYVSAYLNDAAWIAPAAREPQP
ncbi:MAG: Papain family cysteine protease [Armatimonadetes bacterium]|jgi:hypothetical protein|nr:Papain family cysteine protease [Armatimonadota bacterium]